VRGMRGRANTSKRDMETALAWPPLVPGGRDDDLGGEETRPAERGMAGMRSVRLRWALQKALAAAETSSPAKEGDARGRDVLALADNSSSARGRESERTKVANQG